MNLEVLIDETENIGAKVDAWVFRGKAPSKAELEGIQRQLFIAVRDLSTAAVKLYTLIRHAS